MKFIVSILVTAILAYSLGLVLPWWSIAIAGFSSGLLIAQKRFFSFLSSFLAVFLTWGIIAFFISQSNDHILAHRISMLVMKNDNPIMLIVVTALIGGITSGFSSITGRSLAIILKKS
jgi:hypothetical protein